MNEIEIKQKILDHLNSLNRLENHTKTEELISNLAKRFNVSVVLIEQAIAEWSAGRPE